MFSPYLTSAEIQAQILGRHHVEQKSAEGEMISHRIVSTPNGQHYGKEGHIPCNHEAEFLYLDGAFKTAYSDSQAHTIHWRNH